MVIVAALVVAKVSGVGGGGGSARQPLPGSAAQQLDSIQLNTLVDATNDKSLGLYAPQKISDAPLTFDNKPEMLYIGAEFCPVCATERWAMYLALKQFGTFSNVSKTHSALSDGNIPTLSFYGAKYTSPYLSFVSVENETNTRALLQSPTPAELSLWEKYTETNGETSFPFIDIDGKWVITSAQAQSAESELEGLSFNDALNQMGSNNTSIGVQEDAAAAVLVKAICSATGQQPAATCKAVANVPMGTSSTGASSSAG